MKLTRTSRNTLRIEQTNVFIALFISLGSLVLMATAVSGWASTGYQDIWPMIGKCIGGLFGLGVGATFLENTTIAFDRAHRTVTTTKTTAYFWHEEVERPLHCVKIVEACARRDDLVLTIDWDGRPQEFRLRHNEDEKEKAINIAAEVESWLRTVDSNATKV